MHGLPSRSCVPCLRDSRSKVLHGDAQTCLGSSTDIGGFQRDYHNWSARYGYVFSFTFLIIAKDKLGFIGKTTSQFYMLLRLLLRKQVVLFILNGERLYLFYYGKVYTTTMQSLNAIESGRQLPNQKLWSSKVFIWTLFDIENRKGPQMRLLTPLCSPVQTASPDPIRFQDWDKKFAGMSLWAHDEPHKGVSCLSHVSFHTGHNLLYQERYDSF